MVKSEKTQPWMFFDASRLRLTAGGSFPIYLKGTGLRWNHHQRFRVAPARSHHCLAVVEIVAAHLQKADILREFALSGRAENSAAQA